MTVSQVLAQRPRAIEVLSPHPHFAALEGASLLNLCLWLLTGTLLPFVAIVVVLILIAIANFPRART